MTASRPHLGRAARVLLIALLLHLIADGAGLALPNAARADSWCGLAQASGGGLIAEGHVACLHTPPPAAQPALIGQLSGGQYPQPLMPSLAPLTPPPLPGHQR